MKSKKICALITLAALTTTTLFPSTSFAAAAKPSTAITTTGVTVTNKFGTGDTIVIPAGNLTDGDTVNVYKDARKTTKVGTGTYAASNNANLTITATADLGNAAGNIYLTRTDKAGDPESAVSAAVPYTQATTDALQSTDVKITDNVDYGDTVEVTGKLTAGEVVNVYSEAGTKLGSGKANASGGAKIVLGAKALDETANANSVEITGIAPGAAESAKTKVTYTQEVQTKITGTVTITKNITKPDTLEVTGVAQNGIVYVYGSTGALIGSGKQPAAGTATVKITFAKHLTVGEQLNVKVKEPNMQLSAASQPKVPSNNPTTTVLQATDVKIQNNVDTPDTVTVLKGNKIQAKAVVKVYGTDGKTLLGKTVVTNLNAGNDIVVKLPKSTTIPSTPAATDNLYITVTDDNCDEGKQLALPLKGIDETQCAFTAKDVTVQANITKPDQITIKAGVVKVNGVVRVYAAGTKTVLATAVCKDKTKDVVINLLKHLAGADIDITVKNPEELLGTVSKATITPANATQYTVQGLGTDIIVTNNVDTPDTVKVPSSVTQKMVKGSVVKVYADTNKSKLLVLGAVIQGKDLIMRLPKGALDAVGANTKLYVTVIEPNCTESKPAEVICAKCDEKTKTLTTADVAAQANVTKPDQVTVKAGAVDKNGVVKVYSKDGKILLATAVCRDITKDIVINLPKHVTDGAVSVTVKNPETQLSNALAVTVANAAATKDVLQGTEGTADVEMQNNVDAPDTIKILAAGIGKLKIGDIVKVYDAKKVVVAKLVITQPVINAGAKNGVVIRLPKSTTLDNDADGQLTLTVTSPNSTESNPSILKYNKADVTADIASTEILAASNAVMVTNVKAGDKVFVYDSDPLTNKTAKLMGSGLVVGKNNYVFISFKAQTSTYCVVKKSSEKKMSANAAKVSIDQNGKATITCAGASK